MKNKPLSFQLWLIISLLILSVLLSIFVVLNFSTRNFFERQTFETIEFSQSKRLQNTERLGAEALENVLDSIDTTVSQSAIEYERSVNHLFLTKKRLENDNTIAAKDLPLINKIKSTVLTQEDTQKRYIFKTDQQIYAVVTKVQMKNQKVFLLSYMHETYTKGLIKQMNRNIIVILIISLLLSSIIAKIIASRITKPLKALEIQFSHIARKEWQEDLEFDRQDEIGNLAKSANLMQTTLQLKDVEERDFIQTVSHDLKTPIMVIRSYAQAVLDGVISTDDLKGSIQLIDNEADKMNDKIKDLLYLYTLRNQQKVFEDVVEISSSIFLNKLIKRFQYSTEDINCIFNIEDTTLIINEKIFTVAIENIIENALRFAQTTIELTCSIVNSTILITIYNDGSILNSPNKIFERYATESQGNTGLGMAITREIIHNHNGTIMAQNEDNGVRFIISLPKLV